MVHTTWIHARVSGMFTRVDEALAFADAGLGSDSFDTAAAPASKSGGSAGYERS
jgi:hypothetical protein